MKKILFPLFVMCLCKLQAQEQPAKIKEYGVGFSSLNSFSLQYRWGNEKMIYRAQGNLGMNTAFGKNSSNTGFSDTLRNQSTIQNSKITTPININAGLSLSALALKQVSDKFGLMCGPTIGFSYGYNITNVTGTGTIAGTNTYPNGTYPNNATSKVTSLSVRPYLGITWGVFYKIHPSFVAYLEITPNLFYNYSKTTTNTTTTDIQTRTRSFTSSNNSIGIANLSNSGAMITFAYRITK